MGGRNVPSLTIRLLGQFEVLIGGELVPVSAWGRRKTKTLLKILLIRRGRVSSQDQLIESLYGGNEPQKKLGNLRGRISQLRHALEPDLDRGSDSQYILHLGDGYCFSSRASVWLDVEAFRSHIADAEQAHESGQPRVAADSYEEALALYRGDFLETDPYEEWSLAPRERLREEHLAALSELSSCYVELGDYRKAIACCKRILDVQPARESTIRRLMQLHHLAGEDSLATETFEQGKQALKERLNVDPSAETSALLKDIQEGRIERRIGLPDPLRVAVLPFVNLCPDPEDEYLVDGMTEELIYALAKVRELKVIAQTSVLAYKNSGKSVSQIGRELSVGTIVEGSVRRADNDLRITAQLIDVTSGEHLWAGAYDRELGDVFAVQREISGEVAWHLRQRLAQAEGPPPEPRYTGDPEAYRLFLEGRYFLKKRYEDALQKAHEAFERALAIDESFGLARAGLSLAVWLLARFGFLPFEEAVARAELEAKMALAIDDRAGDAYATLAAIQSSIHLDPRSAAVLYDRAVEVEPRNVEARGRRAINLIFLGQPDAAIQSFRQALDIDPLSTLANRNLGYALYVAHRYDEALTQLSKAERLERHDWSLHQCIGSAYLCMFQYEKALGAFEQGVQVVQGSPFKNPELPDLLLAYARELMGHKAVLRQAVELLTAKNASPALVAFGSFLLGDIDAGFKWLERARKKRDGWYLPFLREPMLDPIKSDPRYHSHLANLGIAPQ